MRKQSDVVGTCQRRSMAATATRPSLWDTKGDGETTVDVMRQRNQKAMVLCQACPLLEACEAMLSDHEKRGIAISGVVAGRYSDVPVHTSSQGAEPRQRTCRGCHEQIQPQCLAPGPRSHRKKKLSVHIHVGEGLCQWCHPQISRAARSRISA